MRWVQLAFFIVRMLWRYGPPLWKIGNDIYHDIESKSGAGGKALSSEEKADTFNRKAQMAYTGSHGYMPRRPMLNEFREAVWKRNNIGKEPRKLMDARLRVLPKRPR